MAMRPTMVPLAEVVHVVLDNFKQHYLVLLLVHTSSDKEKLVVLV